MEGINVGLLLDVFLIVFGGYLVYAARNMKKTGKPGNMLLDAEELARCRDSRKMAEEVARYMLPFGAETVLCGIAGTVNMVKYRDIICIFDRVPVVCHKIPAYQGKISIKKPLEKRMEIL